MYSIASASTTHIGKVREINEDAVLETGNLFAVADGMGGHQAGEVASSLALTVIEEYIEDNLGVIPGEKLVEKAMGAANARVHRKATGSAKFRDMGTTVTLLYREGDIAYIGHVGDSRAYLLRAGGLKQLTRDHSLVGKLVEDGEITEEEARQHPQRNIILQALGLAPQVEIDVVSVKIQPGDVYMLATDGLSSLVEDPRIEEVLAAEPEPTTAAKRLVDLALEAGGTDNISVVIVGFQESATTVPAAGAGVAGTGEEAPAGTEKPRAGGRPRSAAIKKALVVIVAVLVVLGAGFGVAFYFYNRTFYVGSRNGKVTLFKGFPFWELAMVERGTDIETRFLPEALRRRVEGKLEPESKRNAERTIGSLEREVEKNSSIVPDVVGKKFVEARALLEKAGLQAKVEPAGIPGMPADLVVVSDPQPGTRVGKGSQVTLKVTVSGPQKEV